LFFTINCHSQNSKSSELVKQKVADYILQLMVDYEITGASVAILKGEKVLYKGYHGKASREFEVPVTENTLFKLHSVTKPIVSTAIFQLVEKNQISLSDPITKYIGIKDGWSSIQIKHLLAHSSGLSEMPKDRNITEEQVKEVVFSKGFQFIPGERFQYASTNYWLLQKIVEKITLKEFGRISFCRNKLKRTF
jgi:CubicO group peptidase (beta-lactamase class C family)